MIKVNQELAALVNRVVRRTMKKCSWMSEDDVRAEAWVAALSALRKFDGRDRPIAAFARRMLETQISRHMLRFSAPVSAPEKQRHALYGIGPGVEIPENLPEERTGLERDRWFRLVELRLSEVLTVAQLEAAVRFHAPERKRMKVQRAPELALASEAVEKIANDEELRRLWSAR